MTGSNTNRDENEEGVSSSFQYDGIPEEEASWLSRLTFAWEKPLFTRASELAKEGKALQQEDLLPLPTVDYGKQLSNVFEQAVAKQQEEYEINKKSSSPATKTAKTKKKASDEKDTEEEDKQENAVNLPKALLQVVGRKFIVAGFVKALNTALQFSFPLLLNAILRFIEESQEGIFDDTDPWHVKYRGYWLSALLLVAMGCKALTESNYFHMVIRSGYQARVAVSVAVYNKSLRLSNAERQSTTLGEMINLMQVDASKIEAFIPQFHVLWDGMFQILGYMTILYTLIGWPCFVGLAVMIFAFPVQGSVMKRLFGMNREMVKYTDKRIEVTNEALQGIQCVKMYTWEERFAANIKASRSEEMDFLGRAAYLKGFSRAYMGALPGVVAVVSFIAYALFVPDSEISASTLFSALVAFDQLRFPLLFYPMALAQLVQAKVSTGRVEQFLGLKEVGNGQHGESTFNRDEQAAGEIIVKDAEVYWSDPNVPLEAPTKDGEASDNSTAFLSNSGSMGKDDEENSISDIESSAHTLVYPKAALRNINMQVKTSELAVVIGRVGSGKTTLCSAILNEAYLKQGEVTLNGNVAYASQTPWVLNATLQENILFGLPMDEERYKKVLQVCQLEHDIKMLEDGDQTEIGERGINLSGGQKARVSVARAAYSNADVIILDDPLSALDPEVARNLFFDCIVDLMHGKTRLLVTNQLQFLSSCDSIVALRHGKIIEQGSYDDLIADKGSEVNRLMNNGMSRLSTQSSKSRLIPEGEELDSEKPDKQESPLAKKEGDNKALVTKEERNIGAVTLAVYLKYLKAGGGYLKFALVYFAFVLSTLNGLAITSWISFWTTDGGYENNSQAFYLGIYFSLTVLLGLITFGRAYLLARFGVDASTGLHENLLDSILRAPQSFFDTTPLGRIISRFSKDLYSIDLELTDFFDFFLFCTLQVLVSLGTILYVTPWFGVAIPPLGFIYFRVLNYFRRVSRETKRLDSISRSPVYAHFSETLGGLVTIRAYGQSSRFMGDFEERVDNNTKGYYNNKGAERWLSIRLEMIGSVIAGLAAFFACNTAIRMATSGDVDSNFSSIAGLSLTFAISMTSLLNWVVRSFAQLEAAMNACERVLYYTEDIPREAARTSSELQQIADSKKDDYDCEPSVFAVHASGGKVEDVTESWPMTGKLDLTDLQMRYRKDTPLVLKGLNVIIESGERVGIVGRTGSGKSSTLLALLRLVEPSLPAEADTYEAPIKLDGIDVMRIGLKELRSKIGIIPQNPVLFSGTIRSNVDPFDQYTDDQIWDALQQCGLNESVAGMPGELEAVVSEYGENLSAGMRQMLVLGRALLRQCKLLLLDEATSSVDYETDKEIQRTLREAFSGCTILTIAHRINTILDSDKILVMKDGLAAEFAPPQDLLSDETSIFSEIVRHAEAEEEN